MSTTLPIENYGLIGDMFSAALVGTNGSIDWLCLPRFDSPSVFGKLLDSEKGGHFQIRFQNDEARTSQFYWPDTNVLVTRFFCKDGVGEIVDFMPIKSSEDTEEYKLIRIVKATRGVAHLKLACFPAFDYARQPHTTDVNSHGACFRSKDLNLTLTSSIPLILSETGVTAEFDLSEGESLTFTLQQIESECAMAPQQDEADALFLETVHYWRNWISQCTYKGRWREMICRSAFTLKLLTYQPTGAIVAAPTTSLPEGIGGDRNWDYRYTWIRDASMTLYGLFRIGFTKESEHFMTWLQARCAELKEKETLQVMYSITGESNLEEFTLPHLSGYANSSPVRIGNGAHRQIQLDISGSLMNAVLLYDKYVAPISYAFWKYLRKEIDWVCEHWEKPDEGIWEVRSGKQQFVYSKLMCWVALDRAIRVAENRSLPYPREKWHTIRDEIFETIIKKGWSDKLQSFTQAFEGDTLDASALFITLSMFLPTSDPMVAKTIQAISKSVKDGGLTTDSLVFRYNGKIFNDGFKNEEGTFSMCSFWLVEALALSGKQNPQLLEDARLMFDKMLTYTNHLGLYSEQIGPTGESLGNFPQAFTHLSLISAAITLDEALDNQSS